MAWYGPRLASQGFVVITIDTNTVYDSPPSRGTQLLAALDYLTEESTVADRIDPERLAVMGWSMGGGGALEASVTRPSLRASIPLAPWHSVSDWSAVTVPTLVVGCEADTLATVDQHAVPFYESLPDTIRSGYVEIAGGNHFCVVYANDTIARQVISFPKRNLDSDTRYSQFLCPAPSIGGAVSDSRSTCPY